MNDLIAYSFKDQVLRTQFSKEGEPLFCLADVCEVLELTNPSSVAASIKEEFELPKLNLGSFDTGYGEKDLIMLTGPQLYYVLMRSKAKKARPFRQWVVNEVLPTIRKQGYYSTKEQNKDNLLKRLEFLKACLDTGNITKEEQITMLESIRKEYTNY